MFDASNQTSIEVVGFMDAERADDIAEIKSTSGCVFQMWSRTVSWCCKHQEVAALSSTEAEYISL